MKIKILLIALLGSLLTTSAFANVYQIMYSIFEPNLGVTRYYTKQIVANNEDQAKAIFKYYLPDGTIMNVVQIQ